MSYFIDQNSNVNDVDMMVFELRLFSPSPAVESGG